MKRLIKLWRRLWAPRVVNVHVHYVRTPGTFAFKASQSQIAGRLRGAFSEQR